MYNSRLRGPLRARAQTAFGLALLIGSAAFTHAAGLGCTRAELLAINDDNAYAERLVKYYARLGFTPVRCVAAHLARACAPVPQPFSRARACMCVLLRRVVGGNGLRDLPDLLVWGGAGTRMDADVLHTITLRRVLCGHAAPPLHVVVVSPRASL